MKPREEDVSDYVTPTIPTDPRPPSIPVRIAREVGVPIVAVAYLGVMGFLLYSKVLSEASFVGLVGVPVGGYLGSLVPKLNQEKHR